MEGTNETKELTLGEYRVGIGFNPGGNDRVNTAKRLAASVITKAEQDKDDYLVSLAPGEKPNGEIMRLYALAQTAYEEAAMWHVKAITKEPRG